MSLKIDKELQKKAEEKRKILNADPVKQVQLLLEDQSQQDAHILRGLSDNSHFNKIERVRGSFLELEKLESQFDGNVFEISEIKEMALNYNLRFLNSRLFTGAYDVEVASKIREFSKKTDVLINDATLKYNFYILAPKEMFDLNVEKHVSKAELRRELRRRLDPIIFYKIDDTHYRMIHKWGQDFTPLRALSGYRWRNFGNFMRFNTFLVMPFVAMVWLMFCNNPATEISNHPILFSTLLFGFSYVVAFLLFGIKVTDELTPIAGFFSEKNWNENTQTTKD